MAKSNSLANEITKVLEMYSQNVKEEVNQATAEAANTAVKILKTTGDYDDYRGEYRKSFDITKTKKGNTTVFSSEYRLTHLLEKGHMTRDGTSRTNAYPHWKPAEEKAIKEFEENLVKGIEGVDI
jgi:hypothetical protein